MKAPLKSTALFVVKSKEHSTMQSRYYGEGSTDINQGRALFVVISKDKLVTPPFEDIDTSMFPTSYRILHSLTHGNIKALGLRILRDAIRVVEEKGVTKVIRRGRKSPNLVTTNI